MSGITPAASPWARPETWVPLARRLHAGLLPGSDRARVVRTGGSFRSVTGAGTTLLADAVDGVERTEPSAGRTVVLTVERTGAWQVAIRARGDHDDAVVVLRPGAVPAQSRAPAPTTAPRGSNDLDLIRGEIRRHVPDAVGATPEQLAEVERVLGRPLPPELRALFETIAAGFVDLLDDEPDDDEPADAENRWFRVTQPDRFHTDWVQGSPEQARGLEGVDYWRLAVTDVPNAYPEGAVRRLACCPGWIPFADDGGGNLYCLDLAPGPTGTVGQVVQLSHEGPDNVLVADSLTDFVRGTPTRLDPYAEEPRQLWASVPGRHDLRRLDELAPDLQVLSLGGAAVDLSGRALPALRSLTVAHGALTDVRQVLALPALEYLELSPVDWDALLDGGTVPRTLLATGFTPDGNARDVVTSEMRTVASRIRAAYGLPEPHRTVLTGRL